MHMQQLNKENQSAVMQAYEWDIILKSLIREGRGILSVKLHKSINQCSLTESYNWYKNTKQLIESEES